MTIRFVSLITRDNRPLYVQPFSQYDKEAASEEDKTSFVEEKHVNELLKYNFLSHMSLDIFESPFYERTPKGGNLLFIQDGIYVYGFETNTGLKIVLGSSQKEVAEDALVDVFRDIHKAYLRLICNPFRSSNEITTIENPTFDKRIMEIVTKWNGSES